jgi:hypothetical protein
LQEIISPLAIEQEEKLRVAPPGEALDMSKVTMSREVGQEE